MIYRQSQSDRLARSVLFALALAWLPVSAETDQGRIYQSTSADGEVSFSDEPSPGAQIVKTPLASGQPDSEAELRRQSADQVAQMLAVADGMEQSRLEREAEREERRRLEQREQRRAQEEALLEAQLEEQYRASTYREPWYRGPYYHDGPYHYPYPGGGQEAPDVESPPNGEQGEERPVFRSRLNRPD